MDDELDGLILAVREQPERLAPLLGVLVDFRHPGEVAAVLDALRDAKRQLDEFRALCEQVLRLEATRQGTKTLHLGALDVVVYGGPKAEYDAELLATELRALGLPEERLAMAVVETVSYKVDQRVLAQLAAANDEYRAAIERCRQTVPTPWRVKVEQAR